MIKKMVDRDSLSDELIIRIHIALGMVKKLANEAKVNPTLGRTTSHMLSAITHDLVSHLAGQFNPAAKAAALAVELDVERALENGIQLAKPMIESRRTSRHSRLLETA